MLICHQICTQLSILISLIVGKKKTLMSKSPRKMKTRKATVKVPEIEPHVIENEAIVKLASYSH